MGVYNTPRIEGPGGVPGRIFRCDRKSYREENITGPLPNLGRNPPWLLQVFAVSGSRSW
jgi:hypothetical protein